MFACAVVQVTITSKNFTISPSVLCNGNKCQMHSNVSYNIITHCFLHQIENIFTPSISIRETPFVSCQNYTVEVENGLTNCSDSFLNSCQFLGNGIEVYTQILSSTLNKNSSLYTIATPVLAKSTKINILQDKKVIFTHVFQALEGQTVLNLNFTAYLGSLSHNLSSPLTFTPQENLIAACMTTLPQVQARLQIPTCSFRLNNTKIDTLILAFPPLIDTNYQIDSFAGHEFFPQTPHAVTHYSFADPTVEFLDSIQPYYHQIEEKCTDTWSALTRWGFFTLDDFFIKMPGTVCGKQTAAGEFLLKSIEWTGNVQQNYWDDDLRFRTSDC